MEDRVFDQDYPEEYRDGFVTFYGKKIHVSPSVLIPRLETEVLVRRARHLAQQEHLTQLIDIGTGSGCIGVSLLDIFGDMILVDISDAALEIAQKNIELHDLGWDTVRRTLIQSDLLGSLDLKHLTGDLLVTANLPYIRGGDWENMSSDTRYEPELALFGGALTGFEMYERLFDQLSQWKYDKKRYLIIEFGFDQRERAEHILSLYPWKYTFFPDYRGIERFCEIQII